MSETKTKSADAARSKIMRLDFRDRMAFNGMVRDGFKGRVLIAWLAEHGVANVTPPNLTKYRRSPAYRAWLIDETQVSRDQESAEKSMRLAEALGGSASDKLKSILAGSLFRIMPTASPDDFKPLVNALRAVTDAERLALEKQVVEQKDRALALAVEKFRRDTCALFLKWHADQRVTDIADKPGMSTEEKTELLGKIIFGEDWK